MSALPAVAVDFDHNGFCDIWEARYHAYGLSADGDADGDGQSNHDESVAGTDPFDRTSCFTSTISLSPERSVTIPTQPGKRYQLLVSSGLTGDWKPSGLPVVATGSGHSFRIPGDGNAAFFKVSVSDNDSDADGLDDWAELQLEGFDRRSRRSFPASGSDDIEIARAIVGEWNNRLSVSPDRVSIYENDRSSATITFHRDPAPYPLTVFLNVSGSDDPAKSSATPDDHEPIPSRIVIPAGASSADLTVTPVPDDSAEVPEQLRIEPSGSSGGVTVFIRDAKNTDSNRRLFFAHLRPLDGVGSKGGGTATLQLQGDNDAAWVKVSFSNLNAPVASTQIVNGNASILRTIPSSGYAGHPWEIRASQSYLTDQATLDALLNGEVKFTVYTSDFPTGEIEGTFQTLEGSAEFATPAAPDALESLTGDALDREIVRFLTQATFGPTPESISDMRARVAAAGGNRIAAFGGWIDDQFATPSPSLLAYVTAANRQEMEVYGDSTKNYHKPGGYDPNNTNRRRGWWLHALHAPDQLRQRVGFALSEIFVISNADTIINNRSHGAAMYYDMLVDYADGRFGDLLRDVSKSPMMGHYLSHRANGKATYSPSGVLLTSPDENYAREILQLFSIGLIQLHPDGSAKLDASGSPIPTYGQNDITEFARVFTGWSFSKRNDPMTSPVVIDNDTFSYSYGKAHYEAQWTSPMKQFPEQHDTGAKSFIGLSLPAGQTGEKELDDVVAFLSAHPNTAPFISRRLIQRLVSSNPSPGYLYRVATVFSESEGDLGATVKAILLDPEARSSSEAEEIAGYGKPREPLLKTVAYFRAFGFRSQLLLSDLLAYGYPQAELAKFPAGTTRARMPLTTAPLGQTPQSAPTVFNWFQPDYSPPGVLAANGLFSPELQLANETSVISVINFLYGSVFSSNGYAGPASLPNQTEEPYGYPTGAHYLTGDYTSLQKLYLDVVDTNGDGQFTALDKGTFNNPEAIARACTAVLDRVDLLLCAGELKARYGDAPGQPRKLILDAMTAIRSETNNSNNATNQRNYMNDRMRAALWLVMSSPEFAIQK